MTMFEQMMIISYSFVFKLFFGIMRDVQTSLSFSSQSCSLGHRKSCWSSYGMMIIRYDSYLQAQLMVFQMNCSIFNYWVFFNCHRFTWKVRPFITLLSSWKLHHSLKTVGWSDCVLSDEWFWAYFLLVTKWFCTTG